MTDATADIERPLDRLRVLAKQDVLVTPTLRHIEGFTLEGLLTFLWHGDPGAEQVVLMCGGAMGGLLGPANGLYHDLGETFAGRTHRRRPRRLPAAERSTRVRARRRRRRRTWPIATRARRRHPWDTRSAARWRSTRAACCAR